MSNSQEIMRFAIIFPTYNEKDNLPKLVRAISSLGLDIKIIIVDDNSPDGTGQVADELANEYKEVSVIHRVGKGGRGSACIAGFKKALEKDVSYIVEIDSDLSHDAKDLPKLLQKAKYCDVVVGSRYLEESRIINWPLHRRFFSKCANLYARILLGIPITDYTNGYRCYRKEALATVEFDKVKSNGYIVLSEIAYQLYRRGFSFGEVPTTFINRRRGSSNLSWVEIRDAFLTILRLRLMER